MKILIVNTSDIQGGAARAAYRLHKALLSQNIDIHYSHISSITLHSKLCLLGSNICQN